MKYLALLVLLFSISSCKKYLDKIPNKALTVPQNLTDYQNLIDNNIVFQQTSPGFGELSCDDVLYTQALFQPLNANLKNIYTWSTNTIASYGAYSFDWAYPYRAIFYSNIVLDGLNSIIPDNSTKDAYASLKSQAMFYRSFYFFELEEMFGQPYNPSTIEHDLGIVLRLTSNLNDVSVRSNVKQVYDRILSDLNTAASLAPLSANPNTPNRIDKAAIFALFARIYLQMQNYAQAKIYTDSCLNISPALLDYNTLTNLTSISNPFRPLGPIELLASSTEINYTSLPIDTTLFNSYDSNDLRRLAFFRASGQYHFFKGSYYGLNVYGCSGPSTDEIYLIRAECNARAGNKTEALNDLNKLLSNRYKSGTFVPITTTTTDQALTKILIERRKELVLRGIRWLDLRRLNQDSKYAITLTRSINGQQYTLPPNDLRYTALIPQDEVGISKIDQNPR